MDQLPVPRLNRIIDLLDRGHAVFGCMVSNGNYDDLRVVADSDFDFVIVELEHTPFDLAKLTHSLDAMLNRRLIVEHGLAPSTTPIVRTPSNVGERNQWIVKQLLDAGVYGVV